MKKIFCLSKNVTNFTKVLIQKLNVPYFAEKIPTQQYFEHWNHKEEIELRKEYMGLIHGIKKKAIAEGFIPCFVFEDNLDFNSHEQIEISEEYHNFVFSNAGVVSFNELILNIGKKEHAIH